VNNKSAVWLKVAVLVVVVVALAYVSITYAPAISRLVCNTAKFRAYLLSFGSWSAAVFILIQALQVVIAVIPGELTQLAGGFVYGTFWGTVYSEAGLLLGSVIAFYIARMFGYPLLKVLVPKSHLDKFGFLINNPKGEFGLLVLFLIPALPKDTLTYLAGLTPLKPLRFIFLALVARLPGVLLSSYIGAHVEKHRYTEVIIASAAAIALFIVGVLIREKILRRVRTQSTQCPLPAQDQGDLAKTG
jgi:uncharacterized membrane protein YdjX (TVP38/TMEM64 family)